MIDLADLTTDLTAENWCVNACITDPWRALLQIRAMLQPNDFSDPLNRAIFVVLCVQSDQGDPDNIARLYRSLLAGKDKIGMDRDTIRASLGRIIADPIPTAAHAEYYAKLVKEAAVKRQLQRLAEDLDCLAADEKAADVASRVREQFDALEAELVNASTSEPSVTLEESIRQAEARETRHETGIPFPLEDLNRCVANLEFGEVCVVGARQGHGKTMFALNTVYSASETGIPAAVFSQEMAVHLIGRRVRATAAEIPGADWTPFFRERALCFVNDRCSTAEEILTEMRRLRKSYNVRFFAVDYLQLLRGAGTNKTEELANMSTAFKRAAVELDVAIMILAQFNRAGSDEMSFKGSSQIEQDADIIVLLNWPYAIDETKPRHDYEILVAKARRGMEGSRKIECMFYPSRQLLVDRQAENDSF